MKITLNICILLFLIASASAQEQDFRLFFTSDDNDNYVPFDSIYIHNLDQAGDTTLYYPDTILNLDFAVGVKEVIPENTLSTGGNYPNPFQGSTKLTVDIPIQDMISIQIFDISGREVAAFSGELSEGNHSFTFIASVKGLYLANLIYKGRIESIKMICSSNDNSTSSSLEYNGTESTSTRRYKVQRANIFSFSTGDRLMMIMYAGGEESGVVKKPNKSDTLTMQYAAGIACPEQEEINYMGQTYATVQIFGQCWMKENMNAGMMIAGSDDPSDNDLIEKYCFDDEPSNCNIYGGMYQWQEIMAYAEEPMSQGICPPGWHVPSDEEWIVLEGVTDSVYDIRAIIWNAYFLRGYDAGRKLKSQSGWNDNGNGSDLYGFTALASGSRSNFGEFILQGRNAPFWSSSMFSEYEILYRVLVNTSMQVYRYDFEGDSGFGLRCVRD